MRVGSQTNKFLTCILGRCIENSSVSGTMNPLSFLVVGMLLVSTWSLPVTSFPLPTVSCNDTDVEGAAALALQSINKEQEEGNVLSLFRINAAQKQRRGRGTVFYLTFNVLDTECHVLSRKDYEECEVRYLHEAVYGVCKAVIYVSQRSGGKLLTYNCTLSPVARKEIALVCPDCPPGDSLDKPIYAEIAKLSLSKYNQESNNSKIFAVKNITRASMQSEFGTAYYVEFTVYQTGCTKDNLLENGACETVDLVTRYGYCKGSKISTAEDPIGPASCTIYEPQDQWKHDHRCTHSLKWKCRKGHGQERGHRCAHDHSHEHGQERGHKCAHDHSHEHGHKRGHRCAHDHSHEHGQERGHRCTHGHSHGHRCTHGHSHGHRCTHGYSHGHGLSHGCDVGLVEESSHDHRNDSSEGNYFHAQCRCTVGSVVILPQSINQVDLPDPVLSIPEISWIPSAFILPFPDKSSPGCPAEPKLPQLWVLDLLKPIK
ncbi:fetuin-B-like [Polyodon spathula]|uniref:fetuin-B-like n=1 Tax=Polyodon spathula TaxID=7913 RepID=UPI001B7EC242|nr:fetuin-B-like [Polyodon spathula]